MTLPERPWSNYTRDELLSHIESKHNAMLLAARGKGSLRAELEALRSVHQDAQTELVKLKEQLELRNAVLDACEALNDANMRHLWLFSEPLPVGWF